MKKTAIFVLCISLAGCGTVKKLLKRTPKEEETTQAAVEEEAKPVTPPVTVFTYDALKTPCTFLPSYRDQGGAHLKIDSLNTVLYLDDEVLQAIEHYIESQKQPKAVDSTDDESIVRYYLSKYTADELLSNEISREKARGKPHFKGIFDKHGNLLSLEYFGEQKLEAPDIKKLKYLYASYWDILTNQRINYVDNRGKRPAPHVKFYVDPAKIVHRVEYIDSKKEVIAAGDYTYGVKHLILEQRIVFPNGGKLTDLHPDFFYRQYDRVEAGWVVKCLYEQKDKLSDLVIMQDDGVIFYRYRFNHEVVNDKRIVEAFVYDPAGKIVGRYELYFTEDGELEKKILISDDRKIAGYSTYSVNTENLKMIINSYDQSGKHISRIYRDL